MGMEFLSTKLASGRPAVFVKVTGLVTGDDATRLKQNVAPGAPYAGLPMLTNVAGDADFSMEARKGFADMGDATGDAPIAVVMTSAPLRMVINFIVKAGNLKRKKPTNLKFFAEESEARKWLDAELDKPGGA